MKNTLLLLFCLLAFVANGQNTPSAFQRIEAAMKSFQIDTSAVPNDKLTKEIIAMRKLKGGFNINEAILFKIAEERTKTDASQQELDKMETFFTTGNGKKWADNAIIWIYRKQFTYQEMKQLKKFYKTTAGQKMAESFPIVMLQSLKTAEVIAERFKQGK